MVLIKDITHSVDITVVAEPAIVLEVVSNTLQVGLQSGKLTVKAYALNKASLATSPTWTGTLITQTGLVAVNTAFNTVNDPSCGTITYRLGTAATDALAAKSPYTLIATASGVESSPLYINIKQQQTYSVAVANPVIHSTQDTTTVTLTALNGASTN
jgi:hypothetical protein